MCAILYPRHTKFEWAGIKPNQPKWKNFQNSRLIREGISIQQQNSYRFVRMPFEYMQLECSWNIVGIEDELGTFWHDLK